MTTTTPIAATVTPTSEGMQKIWRTIEGLKPSDKAKITKGDNKLRFLMAERNRPTQEAYREAVNTFCPPRDAKIEEAKAKRDAIIKAANDEYDAIRMELISEADVFIKPVSDASDAEWKKNYNLYKQEWLRLVESVVGHQIL